MRRFSLTLALTLLVSLIVSVAGAQAVVVNDSNAGGTTAGVSLAPGSSLPSGVSAVSSTVGTCDPWLTSDLSLLPSVGLCWHGGTVMHGNETFALTWDPNRWDSLWTRDYVEQFLKDVADGTNTLGSPYAVTTQYRDGVNDPNGPADASGAPNTTGRAENNSKYGGACIDYGNPGGYTCQFGDTTGTGVGNNYPGGCSATPCTLTDADVQSEVLFDLNQTQLRSHLMPGYSPLLVLRTPPGVQVCLDSSGELCSANDSSAPGKFCSYHSEVEGVAYVVQPWTASPACADPTLPSLGSNPTAQQLGVYWGSETVNSLSQAQIGAMVNPGVTTGWIAENGSEIYDNDGCGAYNYASDAVPVGADSYYLRPEFSNAGVIDTDPAVPPCAINVQLEPQFVTPSSIEPGDVVQFDGSVTDSSLIVPKESYAWNFGDGTTAVGPSVEHSYTAGGDYTVTLTVTDRGGNKATLTQTVQVLGANGQPVTGGPGANKHGFKIHLLLMPQSFKAVLRHGLMARLSSNERAAGIATVSISRAAAKRAHIKLGRGPNVVIGIGTLSGVKNGTVSLHLRLSRTVAAKLKRLGRITFTVRLALVSADGDHLAIDAAGRY
jgi:hypothetical protein